MSMTPVPSSHQHTSFSGWGVVSVAPPRFTYGDTLALGIEQIDSLEALSGILDAMVAGNLSNEAIGGFVRMVLYTFEGAPHPLRDPVETARYTIRRLVVLDKAHELLALQQSTALETLFSEAELLVEPLEEEVVS